MVEAYQIASHPEAVGFYGLSRENYISSLISIENINDKVDRSRYDALTEEEKKDIVVTEDGKRFIRKML